jgi:hypothetical protein
MHETTSFVFMILQFLIGPMVSLRTSYLVNRTSLIDFLLKPVTVNQITDTAQYAAFFFTVAKLRAVLYYAAGKAADG